MLRDGQFIKEEPPKIGAHYAPKLVYPETQEERFVQSILLGQKAEHDSVVLRLLKSVLKL
jgi:hypothetical protein